ncbi:peroxisomal sarcosine oxidase-like [Halichondria panicea]|uniref:peroxisomal sarcosine oxidase-like n=1 Tax=Halichondria panicea TaxID=6063 RepID=UPI00312BC3C9
MDYDVIVVGAGVEGSSTAYQLIKNGVRRVLLLEQFHALHTRGSSHGGSRFTRKFSTQPDAVNHMFAESAKVYQELSDKCGKKLCTPVSVVSFGRKDCPYIQRTIDAVREDSVEQPLISAREMNSRFPDQISMPDDFSCVWDNRPSTKLLAPSLIVATFQDLFVRGGGVLLDNHCVMDIVPGDRVIVRTNKGDFSSRKVVITAGAWAPKLISKLGVQLPIKVQRAEVLYFKVDCPDKFSLDKFPILVYENEVLKMDKFYAFPQYEYPGLIKVYYRTARDIEVDDRDEGGAGPESVEKVVQFIKTYLRGVATTPAIFEPCVYSLTPDILPIVDEVPGHSNLLFAAGFSGIGFKLAPAIGQVLTEMVLDRPLSFDISTLRLSRFTMKEKLTVAKL